MHRAVYMRISYTYSFNVQVYSDADMSVWRPLPDILEYADGRTKSPQWLHAVTTLSATSPTLNDFVTDG